MIPHVLEAPRPHLFPLVAAGLIAMGAAAAPPRPAVAASDAGYRVAQRFPIPGDGGWDYLTIDPAARRLYVGRSTRVQVVDLDHSRLLGEVPGFRGVHGVALAPALGRGFVSAAQDSAVGVIDLASLQVVDRIHVPGAGADAILFEPVTRRVFVFCGGSGSAVAIDAASHAVVGTVPLGGRPEFAVADGRGGIFVNLEDSSAVVGLDARTLALRSRWPLAPGTGPSGLAIDRDHRVLFSVCENKLMVVMDADSGRVLATLPIGERVDGAAFDPARQVAYSSNGEGTLTVVKEDDSRHFRVLADVPTQRGARTLAVDEKTHQVVVVTAQFGPPPEPTPERPHPRPAILPGTFGGLVIAPD